MQQRSRIARDRLLELGVMALGEKGYHGTSVRDLVQEAGIPKGSFYNYFESKETFGAEVVDLYVRRVLQRLANLLGEEGNGLAALRTFLEGRLRLHQEHRQGCLVGNLGSELGGGEGVLQEALRKGEAAIRQRFACLIARGQEEGSIRKDVPADALAGLLFSAWEGALMRMQMEDSTEAVSEALSLLLESYFPV